MITKLSIFSDFSGTEFPLRVENIIVLVNISHNLAKKSSDIAIQSIECGIINNSRLVI